MIQTVVDLNVYFTMDPTATEFLNKGPVQDQNISPNKSNIHYKLRDFQKTDQKW